MHNLYYMNLCHLIMNKSRTSSLSYCNHVSHSNSPLHLLIFLTTVARISVFSRGRADVWILPSFSYTWCVCVFLNTIYNVHKHFFSKRYRRITVIHSLIKCADNLIELWTLFHIFHFRYMGWGDVNTMTKYHFIEQNISVTFAFRRFKSSSIAKIGYGYEREFCSLSDYTI